MLDDSCWKVDDRRLISVSFSTLKDGVKDRQEDLGELRNHIK